MADRIPYSTLFIAVTIGNFAGGWSHHPVPYLLLESVIFGLFFTLTWAGWDRINESRKERHG